MNPGCATAYLLAVPEFEHGQQVGRGTQPYCLDRHQGI